MSLATHRESRSYRVPLVWLPLALLLLAVVALPGATPAADGEGKSKLVAKSAPKPPKPPKPPKQPKPTKPAIPTIPAKPTAKPATKPAAKPAAKEAAPLSDTDGGKLLEETTESGKIWAQWAGSSMRNNTPEGKNIPISWGRGDFDDEQNWIPGTGENVKWVVKLGSQSYGNPIISGNKVFVGTNNGAGYLKQYPATVDLGCLLCFDLSDGKFLWQHSSEKLPTGRVHDWPLQGICSAPLVEGERLWFVTSRGEVACLDTNGFLDDENDGPFTAESNAGKDCGDVIWIYDMMKELTVSQHNMCSCSVTAAGDILFVCTSNGHDESHNNIPSPKAPSFLAMDKNTGKVLWSDNSPGDNILHGQWSSPSFAVLGGTPQVIFGGGDGWLYSFLGAATPDGKPQLLWKFDCNPKETKYSVRAASTRNHLIGTPVIYEGLVYIGVGEDPEHGEGVGHFWCIDPTKRGDVSSELAFNTKDLEHPIPHKRMQAVDTKAGDVARPNPNSAAVWHYYQQDWNGDGEIDDFKEQMHRTCGSAAIKNGLLFIADICGLVHCIDAKSGKVHWTHDLMAEIWSSAMIVEDKVFIGTGNSEVAIFGLSSDPTVALKKKEKEKEEKSEEGEEPEEDEWAPLSRVDMSAAVYTTPVVAENILYVADYNHLYAIQAPDAVAQADGENAASDTN